jgi:hypothetical protein
VDARNSALGALRDALRKHGCEGPEALAKLAQEVEDPDEVDGLVEELGVAASDDEERWLHREVLKELNVIQEGCGYHRQRPMRGRRPEQTDGNRLAGAETRNTADAGRWCRRGSRRASTAWPRTMGWHRPEHGQRTGQGGSLPEGARWQLERKRQAEDTKLIVRTSETNCSKLFV